MAKPIISITWDDLPETAPLDDLDATEDALRTLLGVVISLALSRTLRLQGDIQAALAAERSADLDYARLPQEWRW